MVFFKNNFAKLSEGICVASDNYGNTKQLDMFPEGFKVFSISELSILKKRLFSWIQVTAVKENSRRMKLNA